MAAAAAAARRQAVAGLLAGLALLATGCGARVALDLSLDADGAGTLAVTLTADAELEARARAAGVDPLGDVAAAGARLEASGWQVTEVPQTAGGREVRLSVPFAGPAELEEVAGELAAALSAPEMQPLGALRADVTDDEIVVETSAGLVPTGAVADLGLEPDEAVALLVREAAVDYTITLSLPGEVVETNADDPAATPLRWAIAPGEQVRVYAVGERPRSPWLALVAAGAAVGLAVLLVALRATRRGSGG